jgi:hypothetical protein
MPNAPVIFDDGGSTRIKQLRDDVNMDGLLGLPAGAGVAFQAQADGPFTGAGGNFKCHMKVRFHQNDGDQTIKPPAVGPKPAGLDLNAGDQVIITSQNGQIATISFDAANLMNVVLTAGAPGITPLVEAKQNARQRRYIVVNAGAIQFVDHVRAGVSTRIFDLGANASIYTMVHFT